MKNWVLFSAWVALATGVGCNKASEKTTPGAEAESTAAPAASVAVDPDIANVAREVTQAAQAKGKSSAASEEGPPPDGILGPERALKELPPGAAPKVVLAKAGDGALGVLGGKPVAHKALGSLSLSVRTGPRSALPTVDFGFAVAGGEADTSNALNLSLAEVGLNPNQPGALPPSLPRAVATLKGASVDLKRGPQGGVSEVVVKKGAQTDVQMEGLLDAAADAFYGAVLAFPSQAVGVGALWMATSRERFGGAQVMAYRLYEVKEQQGAAAVLSVKTQRYLIDATMADSSVMRFMSSGTADWIVAPGQALPLEGRQQDSMQAILTGPEGQPEQVQWDQRALFAFPVEASSSAAAGPGR